MLLKYVLPGLKSIGYAILAPNDGSHGVMFVHTVYFMLLIF